MSGIRLAGGAGRRRIDCEAQDATRTEVFVSMGMSQKQVQTELGLKLIKKKMEELVPGKRFYVDRQRAEFTLSWKAHLKFAETGFDEPPALERATSNAAALDIDGRVCEGPVKAILAAKAPTQWSL
ncbi:unnamed protein product [Prorocentrum cordatum]|uniref:Uncharacterized protein n=1 Tax=Prorocentrum cordatum TaxID=2364126 RepID=A0ABN9XZD9_9DINO|nr:unnamed protein product [Polarella glacialis]